MMIHSCGNFVHQFGNLEQIHALRGINFGATETPFKAVWERFGGKTAVIPHHRLEQGHPLQRQPEYLDHILRTKTHNRGLCVIVGPSGKMLVTGEIDEAQLAAAFAEQC